MKEISKALQKFQSEIKPVVKDTENPFFKSTYADLTAITEAIKEPLKKNGLCYTQTMKSNGQNILKTILLHADSGEMIESECPLILVKQDMQSLGSAITYARRYSLSAILGLVTEDDDDGNRASGHKKESHAEPKKTPAELYRLMVDALDKTIAESDIDRLATISNKWAHKKNDFPDLAVWQKGMTEIEEAQKTISTNLDKKAASNGK